MNKKIFISRLKELRKEKYKSQREFADAYKERYKTVRRKAKSNPDPDYDLFGTIQSWEQGKTLPSADALFNICEILECDADYLLGRIDHRTHALNEICELTGLSEVAVSRLMESKRTEEISQTDCWSFLMGSDVYYGLPRDWVALSNELFIEIQKECELKALQWEEDYLIGPDRMDLQLDMEGIKTAVDSHRAAFYGLLYNISRNIANYIEENVQSSYQLFREQYGNQCLKQAMESHGQ